MKSLKAVVRTVWREALAISFLLRPSFPQFLSQGMFHLARASIHTELDAKNTPEKFSRLIGDQPKFKTYAVICLGQFCTQTKIRVPADVTLGQVFYDTGAEQLVVFKERGA